MPSISSSFKKIRSSALSGKPFYYVDKTPFIHAILNDPHDAILLPRMRRSGKSLNLDMLATFLDCRNESKETKKLFAALKIRKGPQYKKTWNTHFNKHPVLKVNMSGTISSKDPQEAKVVICTALDELYRDNLWLQAKFPDLKDLHQDIKAKQIPGNAIKALTLALKSHFNKPVFLLVDEYDMIMNYAYINGILPEMRGYLQDLYGLASKDNPSVFKSVFMGVNRLIQSELSHGMNHFCVYDYNHPWFDNYFGFSQQEVDALMKCTNPDATAEDQKQMKEWYNGYQYLPNNDLKYYNPYAVMRYADNLQKKSKDPIQFYWSDSASTRMLKRFMEKNIEQKSKVVKSISELVVDFPYNEEKPGFYIHSLPQLTNLEALENDETGQEWYGFAYHQGYLTAVEKDTQIYLQIPNKEILRAFRIFIIGLLDFQGDLQDVFDLAFDSCEKNTKEIIKKDDFGEYLKKEIFLKFCPYNRSRGSLEVDFRRIFLTYFDIKQGKSTNFNLYQESADSGKRHDIWIEKLSTRSRIIIEVGLDHGDKINLENLAKLAKKKMEQAMEIWDTPPGKQTLDNLSQVLFIGIACDRSDNVVTVSALHKKTSSNDSSQSTYLLDESK
jgi:hypothetical protein